MIYQVQFLHELKICGILETVMKKKTNKKDDASVVEELANKILSLMGTNAKAKASQDADNEAVRVDIDAGEETGLLIGRHGETLSSIQSVLGMMVRNETGEWRRIIVNVGDWREKQEDYLKSLAYQAASRAKETGEEVPLYNLTASQRRVIHLALSEDSEVETESAGEGEERYLVVRPKRK